MRAFIVITLAGVIGAGCQSAPAASTLAGPLPPSATRAARQAALQRLVRGELDAKALPVSISDDGAGYVVSRFDDLTTVRIAVPAPPPPRPQLPPIRPRPPPTRSAKPGSTPLDLPNRNRL